jgi:hypothetical protein
VRRDMLSPKNNGVKWLTLKGIVLSPSNKNLLVTSLMVGLRIN